MGIVHLSKVLALRNAADSLDAMAGKLRALADGYELERKPWPSTDVKTLAVQLGFIAGQLEAERGPLPSGEPEHVPEL